MFRRRHPFLFFILALAAIISLSSVISSLISGITDRRETRKEHVGVIEIKGMILDAETILNHLQLFREQKNIKAVVLRIDSPGGAVGPSQEIYSEIKRTTEVKPVIASMGSVAASGGYYVAAAANGIVANPGTITGSIGVIVQLTNFRELFEKIGIRADTIKSGEFKDISSPFRSLEEDEEKLLQQFVDSVHRQFVSDVAAGRNLSLEDVGQIADGMIFTGEYAQNIGLVDRLGNFNDAIEWAGREGGIEGRISTVYPPEERYSLIRKILGMSMKELESMIYRMNAGSIKGGYMYNPMAGESPSR